MISSNENKNLVDKIATSILVINFIFLVIFRVGEYDGLIANLNFFSVFLICFIVYPTNNFIKEGFFKGKLASVLFIIRIALALMLVVSLYRILLTKNYSLNYTYWVSLISLGILYIINLFIASKRDYLKREAEGKKHNIIFAGTFFLLSVMLILLFGYIVISPIMLTPRHISLENLKVPKAINIHRIGEDSTVPIALISNESEIKDPAVINSIISELKAIDITNIRTTELINYERMKADNSPYYFLFFNYGSETVFKGLEVGYINYLILTPNREVVIVEYGNRDSFFFFRNYFNDIFPVSLSDKTLDMIINYIK